MRKLATPWSSSLGGGAGDWDAANADERRYVWDGWKLLMELACTQPDCGTGFQPVKKYTWGLDLAGQNGSINSLEFAGTIGGLLAAYDTAGTTTTSDDRTFLYTYDANGNVGQLVETTAGTNYGTLAVKYEYGPFGSRVNSPVQGEYEQPFRFSTKQWDDETGLGYWGERYYNPTLGRWISRDPIGDAGGLNLYGYIDNDPTNGIDPAGLMGCTRDVAPGPQKNQCDDCWKTCKANQHLLVGAGGGWICRNDGCRCACVNEKEFPPTGKPADEALRKCVFAHEHDHVRRKGADCSCSPKPCRGGSKPGQKTSRECYASAAEINCLRGERGKCKSDRKCKAQIDGRIKQMEKYCASFGGNVYKYGAKK